MTTSVMAQRRWTLVAVCGVSFVVLMNVTIGIAAGLVVSGPLSDLRGRRRMSKAGLMAFVPGSVLCGFSHSATMRRCRDRGGLILGGLLAAFTMNGSLFAIFFYLVMYLQDDVGYSALVTELRLAIITGATLAPPRGAGRQPARARHDIHQPGCARATPPKSSPGYPRACMSNSVPRCTRDFIIVGESTPQPAFQQRSDTHGQPLTTGERGLQ